MALSARWEPEHSCIVLPCPQPSLSYACEQDHGLEQNVIASAIVPGSKASLQNNKIKNHFKSTPPSPPKKHAYI